VARIPEDHVCYCEPFCGAAWVFFGKEPSKLEVLNDMDGELVNFWRVLQHHLQPFMEYFKYAVISRRLWQWENKKAPETLTDFQRAVRYYYLQRLGFGGKTAARTFGSGATRPMNLNLTTMEETLLEVHWRMERVTIEHLDACNCIERYDRPSTFFYIDPPVPRRRSVLRRQVLRRGFSAASADAGQNQRPVRLESERHEGRPSDVQGVPSGSCKDNLLKWQLAGVRRHAGKGQGRTPDQ
jgi:hypothetical protein